MVLYDIYFIYFLIPWLLPEYFLRESTCKSVHIILETMCVSVLGGAEVPGHSEKGVQEEWTLANVCTVLPRKLDLDCPVSLESVFLKYTYSHLANRAR